MKKSKKTAGVNYNLLDPIKKLAQIAANTTSKHLNDFNFQEIKKSRGESAYIFDMGKFYGAQVIEGLGTKNLIADEMQKSFNKSYYSTIAQDTVAMIVNDLITVGALPVVINAYWAVGSENWFSNVKRNKDLVNGWKKACNLSGCTWGGGETPGLKNIIYPHTIDLAGSVFGIIKPKKRLITGDKIKNNDAIIFIESSGVHANGITKCREIAEKLLDGYKTLLPNGKMYGEELLTPTYIYVRLIKELLKNNIDIHYLVNITGHGWRKLMRANGNFSYIIDKIPTPQPIFQFIQEYGKLTDEEMYSAYNMGAGFAIYLSKKDIVKAQKIIAENKIKSTLAGFIQKGKKQVIIKPKNITFAANTLNIR